MSAVALFHPAWQRPALMAAILAVHGALAWLLAPKTRSMAGIAPPVIEMVTAEPLAVAAPEAPAPAATPEVAEPEAVQPPSEAPPPEPPAAAEPAPQVAEAAPPAPPPDIVAPDAPVLPAVPDSIPPRNREVERRAEQRRIERDRREEQRRRRADEERRQAEARPQRPAPAAPQSPGQAAASGGGASATAYASLVHRILQAKASALGLNARGRISVSFAIDGAGRMAQSGILRSSGDDSIDHAIRAMLARASFPAPPAGRFAGSVTIRVE
ncbi:hypothetical protein BN1110_02092 [bacterium YEK0313]|nr:hypothetical protein BN1110_02092 [bacterium YEK0313]